VNGYSHPPTYLSACSGIGGLDLALERVTGARAVGYCERESYAQAVLMARMEDKALGAAPLWDDLRAVPGARLRGLVDFLIGGIPCQPHSSAGKQRRGDDERDLIDAFCDLAGDMAPRFVFVENVRGFVARDGLGRLLGRLADLGFDAEWCCVRASDVGAPHRRERVFVLAYRSGELADAQYARQRLRRTPHDKDRSDAHGDNADGRDASMAWPPGPDGDWSRILEHLWPALWDPARKRHGDGRQDSTGEQTGVPWQGSEPHGEGSEETEPDLRGVAHGLPELVEPAMRYRIDRLRCLGNAVVPQQAELALRILLDRISSGD